MSILILLSKLKNNNITLVHIKFPNITPGIFQIILKYIYGGIISLNEQEPLEALEVLAAADQLYFQEVDEY
ncbi:BTB/POZ protein [Rhizophagus clarus]|uniref:BTB/POZ protein n=1 Tax=Rhizophagus clarus TaxID=94130 RepID=A0A8H3LPP8_9GLOM|nr:BTB/POZ protein [Rhizophagus clarus]